MSIRAVQWKEQFGKVKWSFVRHADKSGNKLTRNRAKALSDAVQNWGHVGQYCPSEETKRQRKVTIGHRPVFWSTIDVAFLPFQLNETSFSLTKCSFALARIIQY